MIEYLMKELLLTRDWVCWADSLESSNKKIIQIDPEWNINSILKEILSTNFIPKISGDHATWSVADKNPIAVIAQEWNEPMLICMPDFPYQGTNHFVDLKCLHFNYHMQIDPNEVYKVLHNYRSASGM